MACKTCKNSAVKLPFPVQNFYKADSNCNSTIEDINMLCERVSCIQKKIPLYLYNKYYGYLLSMKKLQDYCRYDLTGLYKLLEVYEC